jgi:hypothetical protein
VFGSLHEALQGKCSVFDSLYGVCGLAYGIQRFPLGLAHGICEKMTDSLGWPFLQGMDLVMY